MTTKRKNNDGLDRYIGQLDLDSEFLSNNHELAERADEIAIFLQLTYGSETKDAFMELVDYDSPVESSIGKMRAFLYSLKNRPISFLSSPQNVSNENMPEFSTTSKSVFIVHGHDKETKETVARFITKLGLDPIILHEQPNNGKALIDKFERDAKDVAFAVVLLTADDKGAPVGSKDFKNRARQNVIYELGFFNAKLSRPRVCVLKKGDIEVLSDYLGVGYVEFDENGAWKNQLVREMKAAGLSISSNNLERALLT